MAGLCNVCQVFGPQAGEKADMLVPRILGRSAIEAACRLADSFKVKKKDLRLGTMLNRLKREAEVRLGQAHLKGFSFSTLLVDSSPL